MIQNWADLSESVPIIARYVVPLFFIHHQILAIIHHPNSDNATLNPPFDQSGREDAENFEQHIGRVHRCNRAIIEGWRHLDDIGTNKIDPSQ